MRGTGQKKYAIDVRVKSLGKLIIVEIRRKTPGFHSIQAI